MVNWEQVINAMELPELPPKSGQRQPCVCYASDGFGGWTRLPGAWSFIPPVPEQVISPEMLDRAVELSKQIGPARIEATLKMQADQAMLDYFRAGT